MGGGCHRLAVGSGLYVAGIATTIILLAILAGLKPLQERYHGRLRAQPPRVVAVPGQISFDTMKEVAGERASRIRQYVVQRAADPSQGEILISFARLSNQSVAEIAQVLRARPEVVSVENVES